MWPKGRVGSTPTTDMAFVRKYTKEQLEIAATKATSVAGVCRVLGINNPGGSSQTNMRNRLRQLGIDTSHFLGQGSNKGKRSHNRRTPEQVLVVLAQGSYRAEAKVLRRVLVETGRKYVCASCFNDGSWLGQPMTLEVHHIDGDWHNNLEGNLEFVCPNCHSQK